MARLRCLFAGGVLGALLVSTVEVQAEGPALPSRLTLHFTAPEGCPDSSVLKREIQEFTDVASQPEMVPLVVEGVVTPSSEGFLLSLSLRDNGFAKQRTLVAPTCEEVAHAAALIIAMAIDPAVLMRQKSVEEQPPPNGYHCRVRDVTAVMTAEPPRSPKSEMSALAPCPSGPVVAPPQTKERSEMRALRRYRFGLAAFGSYRVLPEFALGQAVFSAYQGERIRLEVALSELSRGAVQGFAQRTADFSLYRGSAKGCWSVAQTSWFVSPCAALEGGMMRAQGHGVPEPRRLFAPWLSSSVGMFAEVPITEGARLGFTADLGIPLLRERYVLSGEQIYKPGISGTFGASLSAGW